MANFRSMALAAILATAASGAAAEETIEEVLVVAAPIRDSQQAAIDAKRESVNITDVISADTIGRFPDQNLADSLGRVPGLAIERDQGQARYINFRGMPFRYTAIGFDGVGVQGAENGRIPRFDSFPSVITSRIEVNKAVLPSMTGEAVAGFVNIETFDPFTRDGFSGDADIGFGQQDLGKGDVEKRGLRASWSGGDFGWLLFGSNNRREQITDNHEYDLAPSATGIQVNQIQFRNYRLEREDEAYGGRLEYRSYDSGVRVFASYLYSEFVDLEDRSHYQFNFVTAPEGATGSNLPITIDQLLEYGRYDNSTETATVGLDFQWAEWEVQVRYNATATEFNTRLPILFNSGVNFLTRTPSITLASYDVTDVLEPVVTLAAPLSSYDYGALYAYKIDWPLDVDADKFKVDLQRELSIADAPSVLSIGLMADRRDVSGYVATHFDLFAFDQDFDFITTDSLDIPSFDTGEPWHNNTPNTVGGTYHDNKALRDAWASHSMIDPTITDDQRIAIKEDITAAYAMLQNDFAWGNLVYGVRIEYTDYSSSGTIDGAAIAYDDDFTNVLPSAHVNVDLTETVKARLSVSTGVNRPTYIEWRAAASIDPTTRTAQGGNPTLEAEESVGVDAAIEYYFAPTSILSAGVFARSIDNVIYESTFRIDGGIYGSAYAGQTWDLDGFVNGDDGELLGAEVNLIAQLGDLQPVLDGFGISLNVTALDGEFEELDGTQSGLPDTSDLMYNASLFYENHGLSVRLNYQYRDEWISPIEDPSEVWDEQERLDLNVQYQLPWGFNGAVATVYLNANNLTDETDVRFRGNGTVNQAESYGSRYLIGFRLSY